MDINLLIAVISIIGLLYVYLTRNYGYWSKRGIPTVPYLALPYLGNTWPLHFTGLNQMALLSNFYKKGKGSSMIGFYDFTTPVLLLRDPELVKSVLATNFNIFQKNHSFVEDNINLFPSKNPFYYTGNEWKEMRGNITRMLTAAKTKPIFNQVFDNCDKLDNYINEKVQRSGTFEFEIENLFARYVSEIAANSLFGVEGHSFDDNYKGQSLYDIAKAEINPHYAISGIHSTITSCFLLLNYFFNSSFVPKYDLQELIDSAVDERKKTKTKINDMLQMIIACDKSGGIDKEFVWRHVGIFFFDIYDTTITTMVYLMYQLATNLDVQQKVRDEVRQVLANHDNQLTYETLKDLTYTDQVISESTRLYSSAGAMGKICSETIELVGSDGLSCVLEPGNVVAISMHGLHRDPEHWPDPDVFDPERFSEENKSKWHKFALLPFSEGPRICPAQKLVKLFIKAAFVKLLDNYSFTLSSKTKAPLQVDPYHVFGLPIGKVWINVQKLS